MIKKLKSRYRMTVLNEKTFKEKFSMFLTPLNLIIVAFLFLVVFGGLVYSIVALTPLREVVIPGYADKEYKENANYSRFMVDSLLKESEKKEFYIERLRKFLSGEISELSSPDSIVYDPETLIKEYEISEVDSILRDKIAQEGKYEINHNSAKGAGLQNLFLYKPINGAVSADFNAKIQHFGIDLIAPKNEVVKSVLDGTVTMATYTTDGGHVIQVQHDYNLISIYKHNSTLFKEVGSSVKAGEAIAVIGDSGDHSDGPHLHFELWLKGIPVNPADYFTFGKQQ